MHAAKPGGYRFMATVALLVFFLCGGCAPRVLVRAHPGPQDRGIRYYRPKPYLKVEPAEVLVDKSRTQLVPGMVRISLVYLPDFSEEYAIDVRSGLGTADVGIKLEDGWNLTEISQDLDSQTDENIKALSSLLSAVGDVVPTATQTPPSRSEASFTLPARNVPIGFYESILGRDGRGCKRLYGFRYVGFVPFAACPMTMGGQQQACCDDPLLGLYGLVFVDGQMVFQPLHQLSATPAITGDESASRAAQPSSTAQPSEISSDSPLSGRITPQAAAGSSPDGTLPPPSRLSTGDLEQLAIRLRSFLLEEYSGIGEVRVEGENAGVAITVAVASQVDRMAVRQAAEQWLLQTYGGKLPFEVNLQGY